MSRQYESDVDEAARQRDMDIEAARLQEQSRTLTIAKLRQKIIRHIPYPPFRDETLKQFDEVLKLFGYNR